MKGSKYKNKTYTNIKWNSNNTTDKNTKDTNIYELELHFFQSGGTSVNLNSNNSTHMYGHYSWNDDLEVQNERVVLDKKKEKIHSFQDFRPKVVCNVDMFTLNGSGPMGTTSWDMGSSRGFAANTAIGYVGEIERPSCVTGPIILFGQSVTYTLASINLYSEKFAELDKAFTVRPRCKATISCVPYELNKGEKVKAYDKKTTDVKFGAKGGDIKLTNVTKLFTSGRTNISNTNGVMTQQLIDKMYGCEEKIENELAVADWEELAEESFTIGNGLPLFKTKSYADEITIKFDLEGAGWVYVYPSADKATWGGNINTWNTTSKKLKAGKNDIKLQDVDKGVLYYFVYLPESGDKGIRVEDIRVEIKN